VASLLALAFWACTAAAGPFSNLVVFGDSLSDVGNVGQVPFINVPGPTYWNGRFSNGPVYTEALATGFGLPAIKRSTNGGYDYAYGGARTTGSGFPYNLVVKDIDDQVDEFLSKHDANSSTLYVLFAGANDLIDGETNMLTPVLSLANSMDRLIADGARKFLVFNLPPLGATPRYNGSQTTHELYNARSQDYNNTLSAALGILDFFNPTVSIYQFDVAAMFNQVLANPAAFGLTNVTDSAAPGLDPGDTSYDASLIVPNPNQYLFWDNLHPTAAVHAILARRALDLFRLPGDFNHDDVVNLADYLVWRKGLGTTFVPDDFNIWRSHFGQSVGQGSGLVESAMVPEPMAVSLVVLCSVLLTFVRRRASLRNQRI